MGQPLFFSLSSFLSLSPPLSLRPGTFSAKSRLRRHYSSEKKQCTAGRGRWERAGGRDSGDGAATG